MLHFLGVCLVVWISLVLFGLYWPEQLGRRLVGWCIPLAGMAGAWAWSPQLSSGQRLLLMSAGLLFLIKGTILSRWSPNVLRSYPRLGLLAYMTAWPGMDPTPFAERDPLLEEDGTRFFRGYLFALSGFLLAIATSLSVGLLPVIATGWLGLIALLLMIHCGYSDMLTCLMRLMGWKVKPLFNAPFMSRSLHDFWSRRWNIAFVEMDTILFFRPLKKYTGVLGSIIGVFFISGILHEAALSYPVNAGWGWPLLYFMIQGTLLVLERRVLKVEKTWPRPLARVWTWLCLLLPAGLIFHQPFQQTLIVPLYQFLHQTLTSISLTQWFDLALWLASAGHFVAICAGVQLPARLNWAKETEHLGTFTRKIFYNYYATIGLVLISFGTLGVVFHREFLSGDVVALGLACMMGLFWTMRVLVDFFYFSHDDWPKGPEFVIGHTMLTSMFIAMAGTYWGLIAWHRFMP